ncbi:MAG: PhzF family phenazine biosynthesis isomerase [Pseudomonadota bacterium]
MPQDLPFALYHAFSAGPFGGAAAGIIESTAELTATTMQSIAREIGAPATAFLQRVEGSLVDVRFFSTQTEYGMCGHGTVGLVSHLRETGRLAADRGNAGVTLRTSGGDAVVGIRDVGGETLVMLTLTPSRFEPATPDREALSRALGIESSEIDNTLPMEKAVGDFVHLQVPICSLATMQAMAPDFNAIAALSRANGAHTVTVFTREVHHGHSKVHCRDFCPAVGTPESPGAGTTNGALTAYMVRHGLIGLIDGETTVVLSEQGYECGRPSEIRSEVVAVDGQIEHLAVGGYARKSMVGTFCLSDGDR